MAEMPAEGYGKAALFPSAKARAMPLGALIMRRGNHPSFAESL